MLLALLLLLLCFHRLYSGPLVWLVVQLAAGGVCCQSLCVAHLPPGLIVPAGPLLHDVVRGLGVSLHAELSSTVAAAVVEAVDLQQQQQRHQHQQAEWQQPGGDCKAVYWCCDSNTGNTLASSW